MLAYVGLGSNLGDRAAYLRLGVELIASGEPARVSDVYETAPIGGPPQGPYLNCVLELDTRATARELLARCEAAEVAAGRRRSVKDGPRTLDADVLLVGDLVVRERDLVVPHPRMWSRRFVLQPLAQLAPQLVDPSVLDASEGQVARLGTLGEIR